MTSYFTNRLPVEILREIFCLLPVKTFVEGLKISKKIYNTKCIYQIPILQNVTMYHHNLGTRCTRRASCETGCENRYSFKQMSIIGHVVYHFLRDHKSMIRLNIISWDEERIQKDILSYFPMWCKQLSFGYWINLHLETEDCISILPTHLTHLEFGNMFNQPLQNSKGESLLPKSLKYLTLGQSFGCALVNYRGESILPDTLVYLNIKSDNYRIPRSWGALPKSLRVLVVNKCMSKKMFVDVPKTVKIIYRHYKR